MYLSPVYPGPISGDPMTTIAAGHNGHDRTVPRKKVNALDLPGDQLDA